MAKKRPFEFYFDGTPSGEEDIDCGIRKLSGEPVDIALALGYFASEALKQKNEPHAAIIVINAYHEFMRRNPDMARDIERQLEFKDGARIIRPGADTKFPRPFKPKF